MASTVEGVETEAQLQRLIGICTNAQGYLFSRPRPVDEVIGLYRTLGAVGPLAV